MGKSVSERNKEWFDRWSARYDKFIFRRWMWYWQDQAIAQLPQDSKRVLEVGCGTGVGLEKVAKKFPQAQVFGVDLSEGMLGKAKERLKGFDGVQLSLGDVGALPYGDGQFDAVFCTESFHHFPDPRRALGEMGRVTKRGGKVVVVDVNFQPLIMGNLLFKLEPGFVRMYSKNEFGRFFGEAGLSVVKQERVGLFALLTVGGKK